MATQRQTVNERITELINEQLKNGTIPWAKPWVVNPNGIVSHDTGKPYSIRNKMLLRYGGEYATFNQIKKAGGNVRKGEKSSTVFFGKYLDKLDENGEVVDTYYFLRSFCVFRIGSQTESIKPKYSHLWEGGGLPKDDVEVLNVVNEYCTRSGVKMLNAGSEAFYSRHDDTVQIPGVNNFSNRSKFWHTIFHELAHSTGSPSRLNRVKGDTFGDSKYATEELVADITACLCLGRLELDTTECIENSAAYIKHWQERIKDFKPTDFGECIRQAELACNYIFNTINNQTKE